MPPLARAAPSIARVFSIRLEKAPRSSPAAESSSAAPTLVARIRAADPDAMVGVGLGVSNGAQAAEIVGYADAAVVGSALVRTLLDAEEAGRPDDLSGLRAVVADLADGVRTANRELTSQA